ncbi:MAG: TadE/TadG family type IV pilus assembly protein [Alloacidobacterium sp.]
MASIGGYTAQGFRRLRSQEGSSLVETALSTAALLALLFGIIEIAFALYTYDFVSEAAREAARYAIVRGSTSCTNTPSLTNCNATVAEIQAYVQGLGFPGFTSSNLTITPKWCKVSTSQPATWSSCSSTTSNAPANGVNVVVTYTFPLSIPFWKNQTVSISSTSQMIIAQ